MESFKNMRIAVRLCIALWMIGAGVLHPEPAQAGRLASCPATQPGWTIGGNQYGTQYVTTGTLYDSQVNQHNSVRLCRYTASEYQQATGAAPVYVGTRRYDRLLKISATTADPPQAWVVRLFDTHGQYWCTGSAVAPDWVLTAKHCTSGVGVGSEVRGGVNTQICSNPNPRICAMTRDSFDQRVTVTSVQTYKDGDLVLLKLGRPLVLTMYGAPAIQKMNFEDCLIGDSLFCQRRWNGTAYGWACDGGVTIGNCLNGRDTLSVFSTPFWHNDSDCQNLYVEGTQSQLCATGPDVATMHGNSGGPLVYGGLIVGLFSGGPNPKGTAELLFASLVNGASGLWVFNTTQQTSNIIPAVQ